jgi:hypothetical protein
MGSRFLVAPGWLTTTELDDSDTGRRWSSYPLPGGRSRREHRDPGHGCPRRPATAVVRDGVDQKWSTPMRRSADPWQPEWLLHRPDEPHCNDAPPAAAERPQHRAALSQPGLPPRSASSRGSSRNSQVTRAKSLQKGPAWPGGGWTRYDRRPITSAPERDESVRYRYECAWAGSIEPAVSHGEGAVVGE